MKLDEVKRNIEIAKFTGSVKYIGQPCRKCGSGERYVSDNRCVLCKAGKSYVDKRNCGRRIITKSNLPAWTIKPRPQQNYEDYYFAL